MLSVRRLSFFLSLALVWIVLEAAPAWAVTRQQLVEKAPGETESERCQRVLRDSIRHAKQNQYGRHEPLDNLFTLTAGAGTGAGFLDTGLSLGWEAAVSSLGFVNQPHDWVSLAYHLRVGRLGLIEDLQGEGTFGLDAGAYMVFGGHSYVIEPERVAVKQEKWRSYETRTTRTFYCKAVASHRETGGWSMGVGFDMLARQPSVALGGVWVESQRANGFSKASGGILLSHLVIYPPLPHFGFAFDVRSTDGAESGSGWAAGLGAKVGALHDGDGFDWFLLMSIDFGAMWTNAG